jgi:hypothetical protein
LDDLDVERFGPLAGLVGSWEGAEGLDVSFGHTAGGAVETPYRERMTFAPLGPVENGEQVLYGLDYRTEAWRHGEADPFHTEVGYWLWDAAAGEVIRCFVVPRGSTLIAGGPAAPNAREFTLRAERGSTTHGILANPYLDRAARTTHYEVTVRIEPDGQLFYTEDTVLELTGQEEPFHHTDTNRLIRTS